MHYLAGLFLSLASIPGYTSASIPAGWTAMSIVLPAATWREARLTSLHFLFALFLAYASLSILWSPNPWDGGYRLWQLCLIALAFWYGSSQPDLRPIVCGLAVGCVFSSMLSVAQAQGFQPVLFYSTSASSGLFYNPIFQGMTLALVTLACLCLELWWFIPLLLPGLYLSHSRGAWLALALGVVSWFVPNPRILVIAILLGFLAVTLSKGTNDLERLIIWWSTLTHLTWFGEGSGSFTSLYILWGGRLTHPDSVHNDALQLVFEFGLGAIPFLALVVLCLWRSHAQLWPVIAAFVFLSFFAFPLFTPLCACLFALCAGRVAASRSWSWDRVPMRRRAQLLFAYAQGRFGRSLCRPPLPLQPGT